MLCSQLRLGAKSFFAHFNFQSGLFLSISGFKIDKKLGFSRPWLNQPALAHKTNIVGVSLRKDVLLELALHFFIFSEKRYGKLLGNEGPESAYAQGADYWTLVQEPSHTQQTGYGRRKHITEPERASPEASQADAIGQFRPFFTT